MPKHDDPTDPDVDLDGWVAARARERANRADEQRLRDAAWREDGLTRRHAKNGPSTAPSYVSIPVPDPAPGEPVSVMARRRG